MNKTSDCGSANNEAPHHSLETKQALSRHAAEIMAPAGKPMSSEHIHISAPADKVFKVIQEQREVPSRHIKQLSYDGKTARIQEDLEGVFYYGTVSNIWEEIENSRNRIDIRLVETDKFKSGSGAWIITPEANDKSCDLELDTSLDSGLKLPWVRQITAGELKKDSRKRLDEVKKQAEGFSK